MKNLVPKRRTKIILHNILQCWIETISLNCHLIFNPITGKNSPLHHLVTLMNNFIRELPKNAVIWTIKAQMNYSWQFITTYWSPIFCSDRN